MIVTFQPTINNAADVTACYMNFLRCVTAIATATSGTSSLTVNPYTASNTIDTTKNCIISIDANTEAGGWTTSNSHNVISSLSNTPAAYTPINTAAVFLYKADFYNSSGKSTYPYKKLCFHTYNDPASQNSWSTRSSSSTQFSQSTTRANITANKGANMLITSGCSATTDWTSTTFPPAGNVTTALMNDQVGQTTSYTLNSNTTYGTMINQGPGLVYTDPNIQYHMAVTADYCVIWESKVGDTYANGYFTTTTTGNGTTYWNNARWGSIYYMGLRETQPWENTLTNNPPWVCWQHTGDTIGTGASNSFSHNQVAAYLATVNASGITSANAKIYVTNNSHDTLYFWGNGSSYTGGSSVTPGGRNSSESSYTYTNTDVNKGLDSPIFLTRQMAGIAFSGETGASTNNLYMPQYDTTTGMFIPGVYPIKISRSYPTDWTAGGVCRGIYKSLSMNYATMKLYWQSANQTYTIGTDTYLPFVLNEDMWLIRFAQDNMTTNGNILVSIKLGLKL